MTGSRLLRGIVLLALLLTPTASVAAQQAFELSVSATASCADAEFVVTASGLEDGVDLVWEFGDGETLSEQGMAATPHVVTHTYPAAGQYGWIVTVRTQGESAEIASASGTLQIGPTVTLTSDPFPPLLSLGDGGAAVVITAQVDGAEPISLAWDVGGATTGEAADGSSITATYDAAGKYTATVSATDGCGLTASDSLTIVVGDPEAEACHPAAQRIADAANALFPLQGENLYTCEDILALFEGEDPGANLGFGRMWHAIRLAQTIPDLTWEEILDWHLDQGGWGALVQLNRMAQVAGDVDLAQLMERVRTGETTMQQAREAYRLATRNGASFDEVLDDLAAGADPGDLRQAYRASVELGLSVDDILGYGAAGITPQEIKHAQQLGEDSGQDWAFLLQQHAEGESWGQLKHVQGGMPDDAPGAVNPDAGNPESGKADPGHQDAQGDAGRHETQTAARLAAQFGVSTESVMGLYTDACAMDWNCVRARLMERHKDTGQDKDHKVK